MARRNFNRKSRSKSRRNTSKSLFDKTFKKGVNVVKNTNQSYAPTTSNSVKKTVPMFNNLTKKFFGFFYKKKTQKRRHR